MIPQRISIIYLKNLAQLKLLLAGDRDEHEPNRLRIQSS
jgi:hypothetical protein